ncbi:MAG: hypothetical protein N2D54_08475, partial [Chloroflexota bacterium]
MAFEKTQHYEFLIAWLNEQWEEGDLPAEQYNQLISIAETERDEFLNLLFTPKEEIIPSRSGKEVSRDLAFVEVTLVHLNDWVDLNLVGQSTALAILTYLETQEEKFTKELGENNKIPIELEELEEIDYALDSLEVWAEEAGFSTGITNQKLRDHLIKERKDILEPPPKPKPAPPPKTPKPAAPTIESQGKGEKLSVYVNRQLSTGIPPKELLNYLIKKNVKRK